MGLNERCDDCGANLALVGRSHRCLKRATPNNAIATPNTTPNKSAFVKIEEGLKEVLQAVRGGRSERDKRYRAAHREKRSAYMTEYMRKRRAAAR